MALLPRNVSLGRVTPPTPVLLEQTTVRSAQSTGDLFQFTPNVSPSVHDSHDLERCCLGSIHAEEVVDGPEKEVGVVGGICA